MNDNFSKSYEKYLYVIDDQYILLHRIKHYLMSFAVGIIIVCEVLDKPINKLHQIVIFVILFFTFIFTSTRRIFSPQNAQTLWKKLFISNKYLSGRLLADPIRFMMPFIQLIYSCPPFSGRTNAWPYKTTMNVRYRRLLFEIYLRMLPRPRMLCQSLGHIFC